MPDDRAQLAARGGQLMKGRQMRWVSRVICALIVLGPVPRAFAQDYLDALRGALPVGPASYANWNGPYVGGLIGESWYGVDYTQVAQQDINTISTLDAGFNGIPLSQFPRLSSFNAQAPVFGGFAGYNFQFEDAVVGLEFDYNDSNQSSSMLDSESHDYYLTANSTLYEAKYTVTTSASETVNQYGELRARFGWALGSFLPYLFGGITYSQINASSSVNVNYCSEASPIPPPSNCNNPVSTNPGGNWTLTNQSTGKWYPGYTAGLGVDYSLWQNLFIRAEGQYIAFNAPYSIRLSALSARLGLGLRF
jgi:outer membrane immunogenic protein